MRPTFVRPALSVKQRTSCLCISPPPTRSKKRITFWESFHFPTMKEDMSKAHNETPHSLRLTRTVSWKNHSETFPQVFQSKRLQWVCLSNIHPIYNLIIRIHSLVGPSATVWRYYTMNQTNPRKWPFYTRMQYPAVCFPF